MIVFAGNSKLGRSAWHRSCLGRVRWGWVVVFWFTASVGSAQVLQDYFTNRMVTTNLTGDLVVDNTTATIEPGEPKHGGKEGGHSLWLTWRAPADGVVTFHTDGSTFDTTLSAYYFQSTNDTALDQLKELAENDDEPLDPAPGSLKTSRIAFGVQAGRDYEVAVDGYRGDAGTIRLRWGFEAAPSPPPIVLATPGSQALQIGDPVTLSVALSPEPNVALQWRLNGESIGQTGNTLSYASLQPVHLGTYTVRIEVSVGAERVRFVTNPFELQINSEGETNALARDKLLDSSDTPLVGADGAGGGGAGMLSGLGAGGVVPLTAAAGVVRGYVGSQVFNTAYASSDPNEPPHCGVAGGASYWLAYQAPTGGTITLDTVGSTYDTVLEVYTFNGELTGYEDLISVACNNDDYGTNGPSRVVVPVFGSREYVIVVDGVDAAQGTAWLNYSLNTNTSALPVPPALTGTPQPLTIAAGSTFVLQAPVSGTEPLGFQWSKEGEPLPGATASSLLLAAVVPADTGDYSFSATNDLGGVSGTFGVRVVVPTTCRLRRAAGGVQLSFGTVSGQIYTVEESGAVPGGWVAWPGSLIGNGLTNYFHLWDSGTRFYRVRVD